MANIVVVGAQWGDEAKGKIVDYLTPHADMVVRFGGGRMILPRMAEPRAPVAAGTFAGRPCSVS